MNILLLEDDLVDQMAFKRWMAKELSPCTLKIADCIADGITLVEKNTFDLIVCDYLLPDGNVVDFAKIVDPSKIICISGVNDLDRLGKIHSLGFAHFFYKDNQLNYLEEFKNYVLTLNNKSKEETTNDTSPQASSKVLIHLDNLKRIFDHKPEPIKDVIQVFLKHTPGQLDALLQAVASQNSKSCHSIAHRLKSSFRMMGLFKQMEQLKEIEHVCCSNLKKETYYTSLVKSIQKDAVKAFQLLNDELKTL